MNIKELKLATIKVLLEEIIEGGCRCTIRCTGEPSLYDYTAVKDHFEPCPRKKASLILSLIESVEL